jgi:hypothetical protein
MQADSDSSGQAAGLQQQQQTVKQLLEEAGGLDEDDANDVPADLLVLRIAELHLKGLGILIPNVPRGGQQPHSFSSQPGLVLTLAEATAEGPYISEKEYRAFLLTAPVPDEHDKPTNLLCHVWVAARHRNTWDVIQKHLYPMAMPGRTTPASRAARIKQLARYVAVTLALMHIPYAEGITLHDHLRAVMGVAAIPKVLLGHLYGVIELDQANIWSRHPRESSARLVQKPHDPFTRTQDVMRSFMELADVRGNWSQDTLLAAMQLELKSEDFRKVIKVSIGLECHQAPLRQELISRVEILMPARHC